MMMVSITDADATDMMMMSSLRRSGVRLVADDLGSIFAKLTIHRGLTFAKFGDALAERIEDRLMIA